MFKSMEMQPLFLSFKRGISSEAANELEIALFPDGINRAVSHDDVQAVSRALNIELPKDYIAFLLEYGFAMWDGRIISGVAPVADDQDDLGLSVVKFTRYLHELGDTELKSFLVNSCVISSDNAGGYFLLSEADAEIPGVRYLVRDDQWHTTGNWKSFADFITDITK